MSEHKYLLRVPGSVWDELKVAASRNGRSVNSEILFRISGGVPERVAPERPEASVVGMEVSPAGALVPKRSFQPDFKKGGKR